MTPFTSLLFASFSFELKRCCFTYSDEVLQKRASDRAEVISGADPKAFFKLLDYNSNYLTMQCVECSKGTN